MAARDRVHPTLKLDRKGEEGLSSLAIWFLDKPALIHVALNKLFHPLAREGEREYLSPRFQQFVFNVFFPLHGCKLTCSTVKYKFRNLWNFGGEKRRLVDFVIYEFYPFERYLRQGRSENSMIARQKEGFAAFCIFARSKNNCEDRFDPLSRQTSL